MASSETLMAEAHGDFTDIFVPKEIVTTDGRGSRAAHSS
jgi:hypothetical protein